MEPSDDNMQGPFGSGSIPIDVQFVSKLLSSTISLTNEEDMEDGSDNEDAFALISRNHLDSMAQICYDYTMDKKFSRLNYLQIRKLIINQWQSNEAIRSLNLTTRDCDRIFSGLLQLCQCIRKNIGKNPEQYDQLYQSTLRQTRMPAKILDILFEKFFLDGPQNKQVVNLLPLSNWDWMATGNRLISIKWQLRLVISDRFLSKIMEPYVRFWFEYGSWNGQTKQIVFECRMKQFHQLRFTIAWLLKELERLKANKALQS